METNGIGLVDSGLGGYTIYHRLRETFPSVKFVFIADQKHSPYGDKKKEELLTIGRKLIKTFIRLNVFEVIFACNTLSSTVLSDLQLEFPNVHMTGIIEVTVASIDESAKKILVLATQATINQHTYQQLITDRVKSAWVEEVATPKLVPLIEGLADDVDIDEVVAEYLKKKSKVDTIVLGCTHYPLVESNIRKFTKATIVNSFQGCIDLIKQIKNRPQGESVVYTTLDSFRLESQIEALFQVKEQVNRIILEE